MNAGGVQTISRQSFCAVRWFAKKDPIGNLSS